MKRNLRAFLLFITLLSFSLACGLELHASPTPPARQVTISEIKQNPESYLGKLVSLHGYGIVAMMAPLCPGYTGMDTRTKFIDEQQNDIPAVVAATASGAERGTAVRVFLGYVRIFSGDVGCPGNVSRVNFPYFEIIEIK